MKISWWHDEFHGLHLLSNWHWINHFWHFLSCNGDLLEMLGIPFCCLFLFFIIIFSFLICLICQVEFFFGQTQNYTIYLFWSMLYMLNWPNISVSDGLKPSRIILSKKKSIRQNLIMLNLPIFWLFISLLPICYEVLQLSWWNCRIDS